MSVKIEAQLLPGKKVSLHHLPSGTRITTAAPVDNTGDGSSFSPTDLIAASLCSCVLTTMVIVGERNQYDLTGSHASIEKIMQASPRRVAALPVEFHLPKALSEEARLKMENTAKTCPVHHSLLPDIKIEMRFFYDV